MLKENSYNLIKLLFQIYVIVTFLYLYDLKEISNHCYYLLYKTGQDLKRIKYLKAIKKLSWERHIGIVGLGKNSVGPIRWDSY